MRFLLIFSISIYSILGATTLQCSNPQKLSEDKMITKTEKPQTDVDIYLNKAISQDLLNTFTDVFITISLTNSDSYKIYKDSNCSNVIEQYEQDNRIFGLFKGFNSWRAAYLYPFNDTYIGINTREPYSVKISVWNPNYLRVALFIGGILLFLFAGTLVRNVVFYYTSGCSLGLLASVLIVAIIVYRVAPKKTIGIPIMVGGWSFSAYMLNLAWENLSTILQQYQEYVIGYFAIALLISFAICYKKGPPTDERSHDIAQWTLQLIALAIIYFSIPITRVSVAVITSLILHQGTKSWLWNFIGKFFQQIFWLWQKVFPSKRKLLSEREYIQQTKETTKTELSKLREFCKSPAADAWKITHSVKNPKKLARFIDGSEDHISDEEIMEHDLAADRLERPIEYGFTDDDNYEHEVIIRRRNKHGVTSPDDSFERSFVLPRGVSTQQLFQQISTSAVIEKKKGRLITKSRHSIGGQATVSMLAMSSRQPPITIKTREPSKQIPRPKKPTSKHTKSIHYADYFSSDSEDQDAYEEDLLAQGGDFDFEKD